jgi:UDP-glucose 4-epimerase
MRCFVTGGAGFVGSALVERLLALGHEVTVFDNFSTGRERFLATALGNDACRCVRADLADIDALRQAMVGSEIVFHLAANADVRHGPEQPRRDLEQNTIGTANVLEAARAAGVRRIAFTSTGSVYGESSIIPTPEDAPFPVQTSLYAASKLAAEALLTAYAAAFGIHVTVFRLVSVLGPCYTHGHVFDFCRSLARDPGHLTVLGNGRQRKSYVHVTDCVAAILCGIDHSGSVAIFNVSTDESCEVRQSAEWICARLGVKPKISYGTDVRGWVGDSPHIALDCTRLRALGWYPQWSIEQAVEATVEWLVANDWVFESLPAGIRG